MNNRLPSRLCLAVICCWLAGPAISLAAIHQASVPLDDGRLSLARLTVALAREFHIPAPSGSAVHFPLDLKLDLRGLPGGVAVRGLNQSLAGGFHFAVTPDALIIQVDPEKLPADWDAVTDALTQFVGVAAPDAVARQNARLGLFLPPNIDSAKPLVILIHGLDGDASCCSSLADLLREDGYQAGFFAYPAERSLTHSADALARQLTALSQNYPNLRIDLVTESMGGLVARKYIEGDQYAGSVDHFILIAPPNSGSRWARLALLNKMVVDASNYWRDPQWSAAWIITEGMGQAGHDLRPGSQFLSQLNSRPRRQGVKYTIIAGDRPITHRWEANALTASSNIFPTKVAAFWGIRQTRAALQAKAQRLLEREGTSDGPVSLQSARLAGVPDFVAINADHLSLYETINGQPPAAWPIIEARLRN